MTMNPSRKASPSSIMQRLRRPVILAAAAAAFVLAGCPTEEEELDGCNTHADCPAPHEACILGQCQSIHVVCTGDADCPQWSKCEQGVCVAGKPGCIRDDDCPVGERCEADTGECVPRGVETGCEDDDECEGDWTCVAGECVPPGGGGECETDADCAPPETVCGPHDVCVAGCLDTGCDHEEHCDDSTGRCEPGCASDTDCHHGLSCDTGTGECVGSGECLTEGCPGNELCIFESGLCEPRGAAALGGPCDDGQGGANHSACASDFCAPLTQARICSAVCAHPGHCGLSDFSCLELSPPGASLCLPWDKTGATGSSCTQDEACRSAFCHEQRCMAVCQHDRDCAAQQSGAHCGLLMTAQYLRAGCVTAGGAGTTGATCSNNGACRSGACIGGRCADPCHTSTDCPSGYICRFITHGDGAGLGAVRACTYSDGRATGTGAVGATCDVSSDSPCRSLWCIALEQGDTEGVCIDTCSTGSDCPDGFRCAIAPLGQGDDQILASLCLPR